MMSNRSENETIQCTICASDLTDPCSAGMLSDDGWVCKDDTDGPSHCQLVLEATA